MKAWQYRLENAVRKELAGVAGDSRDNVYGGNKTTRKMIADTQTKISRRKMRRAFLKNKKSLKALVEAGRDDVAVQVLIREANQL